MLAAQNGCCCVRNCHIGDFCVIALRQVPSLSRLIHYHWPAAKHMKCEDVCYVFVIHKKARLLSAQSGWLSVRIKQLLIEGGVATARLLKSLDALCTSSLDRSNS